MHTPGWSRGEDRDIAASTATRPEARFGLAAWRFSFAAFQAWQALAVDDHVSAAVTMSWMAGRVLPHCAPLTQGAN